MDLKQDFAAEFLERAGYAFKGGPGSGNHGHAGRPGKVGGSQTIHINNLPADIRRMRFYHGTPSQAAADSIQKSGQIESRESRSHGLLAPVAGRSYFTSDIDYALVYALGGDMNTGNKFDIERNGPQGYIFEVSGEDLSGDIQPDEDSIGEMIYEKNIPWLRRMAESNLAASTLRRIKDGEYAYWAKAGKVLVKRMTQEQKFELIRQGANIANLGAVKVRKVYRIDKSQKWPRRAIGEENTPESQASQVKAFLAQAKKISYARKEQPAEGSLPRIKEAFFNNIAEAFKGGPGSGNYGHAGRPGKRGGSAPKEGVGAAMSRTSGKWAEENQKRAASFSAERHNAGETIYKIEPKAHPKQNHMGFNKLPNQPGYWFTEHGAYNITEHNPDKPHGPVTLSYWENERRLNKKFDNFNTAWDWAIEHAKKFNPDELI